MEQLHFCGGLPRAGSTVLMNVLQQNPRIFTTSTDPVPSILANVLIKSRSREEFMAMAVEDADKGLYGFATAGTYGWYNQLTDKPIVISKNRSWTGCYHLFPESKYIAMIRDLRDIVESFDRINANSKALHTYDEAHGLLPSMTDDERYHYYFNTANPIAGVLTYELPRIMEAKQKGTRDILLIKYEELVLDPYRELNRVYEFLGEEKFAHDLNNISQSKLFEHDTVYYRERTSHKVSPSLLSKRKEKRVSSPEFHKMIVEQNIPFYQMFYPEVLK